MVWYEDFDRKLEQLFPKMSVLKEEPMSTYTTFRVGGPARRMVFPQSVAETAAVLDLAAENGWPWLVLGNGSNLLVRDEGLDLLVIHTGRMTGKELINETTVRAEAGISLTRLAVFALDHGLAGLAFAHGIPGSLGGAVYMNAGAYGGEMSQVLSAVEAWFPGEGVVRLMPQQLELGYRRSIFSRKQGVVLAAEVTLTPGSKDAIRAEMEELFRRRKEKQPLEYPSAGSTFKRPEGYFAGALIEQCGLKGASVGGAQVSEKHAGFVINKGGATCADVLGLIGHVQETVRQQTGVSLECEVKILG